jgi:hypothetical protein
MSREAFALPVINTLSPDQARSYQERLKPISFLYQGLPFQYGHLIEMPKSTAQYLATSANVIERIVVDLIRDKGLTAWLADHAPQLGKEVLNYQPINIQLERRIIEQGFLLPMVYDGIIIHRNGKPGFAVIEIQTGIAYGPAHRELIHAAGHNPDHQEAWYGPENPFDILCRMKCELANGEEITVMDTNPYARGSQMDQILMAKALGTCQSLPISALDIRHDPEIGYFHYQYTVDPKTGGPIKDLQTGDFIKTERKVPIRHVLARMIQPDLDELDRLLEGNPSQRELTERFFQDEEINWIQHPAWQYIIDKSTLPFLRHVLFQNDSPFKADFVPIYRAGERVPKGTYIRKPTDGASGIDQEIRRVSDGDYTLVEDGYVYQELLMPYPIPIQVPQKLGGTFPVPKDIPPLLREDIVFVGWDRNTTAGTMEVRAMALPWGKRELSMYFLVRLAPRYLHPHTREFTQTNIGKIRKALDHHIPGEDHVLVPFGWCPVVVTEPHPRRSVGTCVSREVMLE